MVDLVVWGHEHQCLLQPELTVSGDKEIFISQPGSSVGKIILQFSKQTLGLKNSISRNFPELVSYIKFFVSTIIFVLSSFSYIPL